MINTIGEPFIELPSIDSTNIYAMQQAHARLATPGTVYFAHEQTAGKGQRDKIWQSEKGKNLVMSAVITPPVPNVNALFLLSAATALACYDFFKVFAGDESSIKWPNDIYWNDRKAGGILIGNVFKGSQWEYAILGIGININQTDFDASLQNPVSLKQITGENFNTIEMAKQLCGFLETKISMLADSGGEVIIEEYNRALYKNGQPVLLKKGNETINGILKGVNGSGELIIYDKRYLKFRFGSVEWIIP